MERQVYATAKKLWPQVPLIVTSQPTSFKNYKTPSYTRDEEIAITVGNLERIKVYPSFGFQIPQVIPDTVWHAYQELVALGYTSHLLK